MGHNLSWDIAGDKNKVFLKYMLPSFVLVHCGGIVYL